MEKCWLRYLEQLASSKLTHRAHAQMWPAFRNCALMEIVRRHYRMRIITPPQVLWMFSSSSMALSWRGKFLDTLSSCAFRT